MDNYDKKTEKFKIFDKNRRKDNYDIPLEESGDSILQTSFCQYSSGCSIGSGFEQHPVHNDHNSFNRNIFQEKSQMSDISMQYDVAFKKPHFLKHSIFEDNTSSFKDESSPNYQSTAASSLSSLTIEDDDYDDNILPNKAGLIEQNYIAINSENSQKTLVQVYPRQDPIGGTCEPVREPTFNEMGNKELWNYQIKLPCTVKQNKNAYMEYNNEQFLKNQQKRIHCTGQNGNDLNKLEYNQSTNQYFNTGQKTYIHSHDDTDEALFKSELRVNYFERNKIKNLQNTSLLTSDKKIDSNILNSCSNKSNRVFAKGTQNICRYNEVNNFEDELNDLSAYEEQLLDQCIRKGMAKVTKRNLSEIKPFCWDLNQICLTTKAMLKIRDDELIKKRNEKCNKYYIRR